MSDSKILPLKCTISFKDSSDIKPHETIFSSPHELMSIKKQIIVDADLMEYDQYKRIYEFASLCCTFQKTENLVVNPWNFHHRKNFSHTYFVVDDNHYETFNDMTKVYIPVKVHNRKIVNDF